MRPFDTARPILITGASGYVGEHLASRLVRQGYTVVGLGHAKPVAVPSAQRLRLDLQDARAVKQCLDQVQPAAVFHCAAQTDAGFCEKNPDTARGQIVAATTHLIDAVAHTAPQTPLIALSTDLVFDGRHAPYGEPDTPHPLSVYGRLKLEAEAVVHTLPRGMVVRTALVYGPPATHKASFLGWMIDRLTQKQPLILFEDEVRTPIFVCDLCDTLIWLAQHGQPGLWHAGGPQRLSRVQMGHLLCDAFGFDPGLIAPKRLADSAYPAPRPADVSLDCTKLWAQLPIQPRSFMEGLQHTASHRQ